MHAVYTGININSLAVEYLLRSGTVPLSPKVWYSTIIQQVQSEYCFRGAIQSPVNAPRLQETTKHGHKICVMSLYRSMCIKYVPLKAHLWNQNKTLCSKGNSAVQCA